MHIDLQTLAVQITSLVAILGGLIFLWGKGIRPLVRWGRDLAHTGATLAALAEPLDPDDPDSPAVIVAAVSQAVGVAEEVRREAHAAAQAAEAAAGLAHEAVQQSTRYATETRANFSALAAWSGQFKGIDPFVLPMVPEQEEVE